MRHAPRLIIAALLAAVPASAYAHFKLLEPASWIVESDRLGDPQKAAPCGGTNTDQGTPTNAVTKLTGGQTLRVKVQETVFHPGHYRISLAANRSEFVDPEVQTRDTPRGAWSTSASIQPAPKPPVLADGLWAHSARGAIAGPFEADVTIPNITCARCTLQVIQFMAEHAYNNPGGYVYHHCADVQITADPKKPLDKGWPTAK